MVQCIAFVLFQKPLDSTMLAHRKQHNTASEKFLSWLARTFQPWPCIPHAELVILDNKCKSYHFATYINSQAEWRNPDMYYKVGNWHALPIAFGRQDVESIVTMCNECELAPYSVWRYVLSTKMFGWASGFVSDSPKTAAHCGALIARILKMADKDALKYSSPRYSPTYLYNEISSKQYKLNYTDSKVASENELMSMSDEELRRLSGDDRMSLLNSYMRSLDYDTMDQLKYSEWIGVVVSRLILVG